MNVNLNEKLPSGWHFARFDEFLERVERKFIIDDSATYNTVGVRWYGQGAFIREALMGMSIRRKQQWIIKSGDVVYNKLFAWKGSFAIADDVVDGCIVSDKFPTYRANTSIIDPKYLRYYFTTTQLAQKAQELSKGAAAISKLTLNPPQFWDLTIPIPIIDEQRRIVARIEELAARIEEARELRRWAAEEIVALSASITRSLFDFKQTRMKPIEDLVGKKNLKNGLSIKSTNDYSHIRCLRLSALRNGKIDCSDSKTVPLTEDEASSYLIQENDVFIVRGNGSKDLVGRAGLVEKAIPGTIFPDLFIRIPLNRNLILPEFFVSWWNSKTMRDAIEEAAKTTSGIWKINQSHISSFVVPILPLDEQNRIIAYLNCMQSKLDALRCLQNETAAELDALMPAILERAFRGEL